MSHLYVNFLAVLVAALASFALGALWYSPALFAKQWMKAHGLTQAKVKAMQKDAAKAYGVTFACQLVLAYALAVLISMLHVVALLTGLKLGILCWVGFAATLGLMAHMYSGKALAAWLIDAGYQLIYILLMAAILTAWH